MVRADLSTGLNGEIENNLFFGGKIIFYCPNVLCYRYIENPQLHDVTGDFSLSLRKVIEIINPPRSDV